MVSDISASGCFILAAGQVEAGELVHLEVVIQDGLTTLWGNVVYGIKEMGFAVHFVFESESDQRSFEQLIRSTH